MKSVITKTVSILALTLTMNARASEAPAEKMETNFAPPAIKLIPELGMSSFTIVGSDIQDLGHRGAASIGVSAKMQTGIDRLQVSGGVEYFEAGGKQDYLFVTQEIQTAYLGIPIKAIYQINDPSVEGVHWHASLGMKPSFLTSAKNKSDSVFADSASETNIKDNVSNFDLMLGAGLSAEYDWQGHIISFGLNYQKGTQTVFKDQGGSRNEGFVAQVGYVFAI